LNIGVPMKKQESGEIDLTLFPFNEKHNVFAKISKNTR